MRDNLESNLYEIYPSLFIQKDWDMTQTCMCWGIDVGDGWYKLLNEMCSEIMAMDGGDKVQFSQVKEKFGWLRISADNQTSEISNVINKYCSLSAETCERCGNPGKIHGGGWAKVECEDCYNRK